MKESLVLFTLCLVFAIIISPAAANEYTRMSEQNITDAKESLASLDIIGAITHMLDAMHWSNVATESVELTPIPTLPTTTIPTTEPTVEAIVTEEPIAMEAPMITTVPTTVPTTEPTPIPTTIMTTIPTTEPTPVPTKDAGKIAESVNKAIEDSKQERAIPAPRNST